MKTYVITFSRHFPSNHPNAGMPTFFVEKIARGNKIHTIRENYELWEKRIKEVQHGEAELSLRYWSEKPYRSPQIEFGRVGMEEGVGIQKLNFGWHNGIQLPIIEGWYMFDDWGSKAHLAKNDGLTLQEWSDWFKTHENDKAADDSLAIIHLTKFRY